MTTTDTRPLPAVPTFPFSMFDPVHLGVDEYGEHVHVNLAERNMLIGGEPGGGKSSAENLIVAHGALSHDCRLVLVDGNQVQLGPWRHSADMFIGPSLSDAKAAFTEFQQIMNRPVRPAAGHRPPQDHPRRRRGHLPGRHRRIRLLLSHHRQEARPRRVRRAGPGPDRPGPRGRGHPHPGHPAAQPPDHRPVHAGSVLLPARVPLHYRLILRCRPRPGLGRQELHRRRNRPPRPRRRLAPVRNRRARAGSRPPGSMTAPSTTWPPTRPSSAAGTPHEHRTRPQRASQPITSSQLCWPQHCQEPLTPNRARPVVENDAYAAFAQRILRAYARRIATGDIESLYPHDPPRRRGRHRDR